MMNMLSAGAEYYATLEIIYDDGRFSGSGISWQLMPPERYFCHHEEHDRACT